jgi:glycolate oxidase subunit GlcD
MDTGLLDRLRAAVGQANVACADADMEVYAYDASLAKARPGAAVFPGSTEEVAAVVRAANEAEVPFVPRGFGTNLSGGSVAPEGGIVICLSRLNRVLGIYPERRTAVVQPGVTNLELQHALGRHGFFFAPDPASQKVATLGGNVGENSGGPRCVKYGVTKNHVLGLTAVLPSGEVIRTGGETFDPPGLDLTGVIIGSEGTMAVVTEITVKILPLPESVVTLLAVYDAVQDAARSVSRIIAQGIQPAALEMMDAPVMRAVEESFPCGYPLDAAAVLIIEVDGPLAGLNDQAEAIEAVCLEHGCRSVRRARDDEERSSLWAGRRGAFGAVARLAPNYLVADCTVPRNALPEALGRVAAIASHYGLEHGNVFHAGDGNLHPLLFFDSRDEDQLQRVRQAGWDIMAACVDLGGTITGEHGVGIEKIEAMRFVYSEEDLSFQRELARAFDPARRLNPNKVIPPERDAAAPLQAPLGHLPEGGLMTPRDASEACAMVRYGEHEGLQLLPAGKSGDSGPWNRPSGPVRLLSSRSFNHILEFDADNLVISAEAGLSLQELQDVLAEHNQWLPLRPPRGRGATLGSIGALNEAGPERFRYGSVRDNVLGLRFVSPQGKHLKAGGRVIKNVAGYDLCRLLVGSQGSLGFITELTFKLMPRPEMTRAIEAKGSLEQVERAAAGILVSSLDPVFIVAWPIEEHALLAENPAFRLQVGFEGWSPTVVSQCEKCLEHLAAAQMRDMKTRDYDLMDGAHPLRWEKWGQKPFSLRCDLPLHRLGEGMRRADRLVPLSEVTADFGCGRLYAATEELSAEHYRSLCGTVREEGGTVVLETAPEDLKRSEDAFGPFREEWQVMGRIKDRLDPKRVFAPGRLPGYGAETAQRG